MEHTENKTTTLHENTRRLAQRKNLPSAATPTTTTTKQQKQKQQTIFRCINTGGHQITALRHTTYNQHANYR